jgi:hypothetical protein
MDALVLKEAEKRGVHVKEVEGTRRTISNLEGDYPEMILLIASMFGSSLVMKICRASFLLEKKIKVLNV